MAGPNAGLTAEGQPRGDQGHAHHDAAATVAAAAAAAGNYHGQSSPTSSVCYMAAAHSTHHTPVAPAPPQPPPPPQQLQLQHQHEQHHLPPQQSLDEQKDGEATPSQRFSHGAHGEDDSTPRSEVPSLPDAVTASLLSQMQPLDPEPNYFSPQPRRLYTSHIPRSAPVSSESSPASSTNASTTSIAPAPPAAIVEPGDLPDTSSLHLDRPTFQRDLSSASTATNATVRANTIDSIRSYTAAPRDGPVYPNQSYAALHLQQHPSPYIPPIVRSRSTHPAHSAANSISGLSSFGLPHDHYRDIMDSGPRTVGNSPVSSPGLFDPKNHRLPQVDQPNDGLYSSPWLHHTHRQAPKETHIADVQADPISGRKIVNQYEIIDELGRGVHGKVKLGKDLEKGNFVAIKIVDRYSKRRRLGKNTSHEDKIKREIAILKKARHPNIVSLLEVIDDPAKKKVYIVLEHVELGEVKWRIEGAKEICLVEWRRIKRESQGIFDNDSANMEDEKIIRTAHQKLAREQRRKARQAQDQRQNLGEHEPWSFEFGGDSEDEYSEAGRSSRASTRDDDRTSGRAHHHERHDNYEGNMETAFRSPTPAAEAQNASTGLEGTMYGAYDTDFVRMRTPSVTGSNSSHHTDSDEDVPEHFRYVPLMTTQAAWEAFKDTVLGLEYLHYQNVYHRDIKPANLLVTKEHRIKISDFGVSYLGRSKTEGGDPDQSESESQEIDEAVELAKTVGTPAFYAPELCRTEVDAETPKIDGGIDVWALGVTLYCLIYGRVPFHDWNTFTLMKVISEEEPYIPKYRLKPVAEYSTSRPSSHGRNSQPMLSSKRAPHDLEYEEVDERLRDLLQRLLVKDSKHRITIPEIKRHPWVLSGISNHNSWVEETDPDRSLQGKKIEISKADLEQAVVPIGIVERVRSAVKKTFDFVAKSSGRGASSRRRAQSSAANQDAPPNISANSSSSTISQDGRRGSLVPGHILEVISRSRDIEHPLSHSVTASPEARERSRYFDSPNSRTGSPAQALERPGMHDRANSSHHTIRHSDLFHGRAGSPSIPPALPGTPTALDTAGNNLGGLFGGLPRRMVNSMRSRDKLRPPREHTRAKSIDKLVGGDDDAHGVPSLAISTTSASGHVDQPDALKDMSPVARGTSPSLSDAQSMDTASRQSSMSSISSRLHRTWANANELEVGPTLDMPSSLSSQDRFLQLTAPPMRPADISLRRPSNPAILARELSEARVDRAKDEFLRRKVREDKIQRERSVSGASAARPTSAYSQTACPPSPDDEAFFQRRQKVEDYLNRTDASSENSPVGGQERGLAFCSSEEQFTPMSHSTSNPSIPSVASAGSSAPDECAPVHDIPSMVPTTSADSFRHKNFDADPAGYEGDHAIDSEEDDDSDDGGLFIGKRKPAAKTHRSESISIAELAHTDLRKDLHNRRRSRRSGSNGTVKKIPPPGESTPDNTPEAH